MKNIFKLTLLVLTTASTMSLADTGNATLDGNVTSYCTVVAGASGVLNMAGQAITTDTPATVVVSNNEDNQYKVVVGNPTGFASTPAGYAGSATLVTKTTLTGANPGTDVAGGADHPLAHAGNDSLAISVEGSASTTLIAGDYTASSVVSCVAQ